jgi:hypothetical protein
VSLTEGDLPDGPPREQSSEHFALVQRILAEWDGYWTTLATYGDGAEEPVMLPLGNDRSPARALHARLADNGGPKRADDGR